MPVSTPDGPDPERLAKLDARLRELRQAQEPEPPKETHYTQLQQGWRMVVELVSGIGIGVVMGYGLDSLLGTIPLMLVIFTLLGLAAGIRTMLRTAKEFQGGQAATAAKEGD